LADKTVVNVMELINGKTELFCLKSNIRRMGLFSRMWAVKNSLSTFMVATAFVMCENELQLPVSTTLTSALLMASEKYRKPRKITIYAMLYEN
jgi:hypothetical protein